MKTFDELKRFLLGAGEWQTKGTPTGYSSSYVQTEPNVIGKAGNAIKGGFDSIVQNLKNKFDPNTIEGFTPQAPAKAMMPAVAPAVASDVVPTSAPTLQDRARNMTLDYSPYIADQAVVDKKFPQGLPQPSFDQLLRILNTSPEDATRSAILKLGETGGFIDNPADFTGNTNGTTDRGANMINSGTFEDMWNKQGNDPTTYPHRERMQNRGINSFEDMKDPDKNELMMELIRRSQGYGAWYGPKNAGFDLNR